MADTITVKFKVMEDGSLKAIGKDADKASAALDKTAKSARTADRNLKGTAQMTSNTTKSFSKMSQGITGGLVPAYATLAANVFALSAAFNFFKRAADVKILEEGQKAYAGTTGVALQSITANLREAAGGMLGFREAAEAAAIGVAKGFSPQQLNELAEGARKAAAALGRNFEDAFDRLIRGASKAEPELLDELGITLRLESATNRYADAVGKSAKELTTFERSQAVLIETQRQLNAMYGEMDAVSNPFVRLGKTFDDIVKAGTNFIMPFFEGLANIINNSAIAAIAVFGALGMSILKAMVPVEGIKEKFDEFQQASTDAVNKAIRRQEAYNKLLDQTKKKLQAAKVQSVQSAAKGIGQTDSKLVQKAQAGQLTDPKQIGQLKSTLKRAEAEYKRHGEITKGIFKGKDIEAVRSLRTALGHMDKDHMSFVQRQKMRFKGLTLAGKAHYTRLKRAGVSTFSALGKAAALAGKAMNKAMKMAGIIGMFMMVWEIGQEIMRSPFKIVQSILKGLDFIVTAAVNGFGFLFQYVGKMQDAILGSLAGLINSAIKGINKLLALAGKDPIELFPTDKTTFEDYGIAMKNFKSNMAGSLEGDGMMGAVGDFLKGVGESRRAAQAADNAFKALKSSINTAGEDLTNITKGLEDFSKNVKTRLDLDLRTGAITLKEFNEQLQMMKASLDIKKAAAIATLGFSTLMRRIKDETDEARLKELSDLLAEKTKEAGQVSAEFAKALAEGDIETMVRLEKHAQAAGAGMTALNAAIMDLGQSLKSGNLEKTEYLLDTLGKMANTTAEEFKKIFGDDSAAAREALTKLEAALESTGKTTSQFKAEIVALRAAIQQLEKEKLLTKLMGGVAGSFRQGAHEVERLKNEIEAVNKKLEAQAYEDGGKALNALKDRLKLELKIAEIRQRYIDAPEGGSGIVAALAVGETKAPEMEDATTFEKIQTLTLAMQGYSEEMKKLGPEGEVVSSVISGAFMMVEAFSQLADTLERVGITGSMSFEQMSEKWEKLSDKEKLQVYSAALGALQSSVAALGNTMAAAARNNIAGIDNQIAAEKKRDGKSAASLKKIEALEKKKEQMKRKEFETNKKFQLANTVIATARGVMEAYAIPFIGPALAAMVAAMGAAQIAIISGMTYQGGGAGASAAAGPSQISVGSRNASVDLARGQNAAGELAYARGESGTGSGMSNFRPAFSGYKNRAAGGFVVGEQGPELFMPEVPGEIIPAGRTPAGQTNVNFSISTVDATGVEELLMNQRGNIIGMIREAANEHGEMFLEGVQEKAY